MDKMPVVIERVYDVPAERVWSAITNRDEMAVWYFDLQAFKAEVGFEFSFEGGADPENPYIHLCKVKEVIPEKKLSYSWRYKGYAGESVVTFELEGNGDKTQLRLTHEGLETFPADNPDLAKHNFVNGWTHIIGTSLTNYLQAK